jgi:hypothetical protein
MHKEAPTPEVKALAATEEPLEDMTRRIIAEHKSNHPEPKRPFSQPMESKRSFSRPEQETFKRSRQDVQPIRPPYQNRQHNEQQRQHKPSPASTSSQGHAFPRRQPIAHCQQRQNFQRYGPPGDSRQRNHERKVFGAAEDHDNEDEDQDLYDRDGRLVFSALKHTDEDHPTEDEGEDRHAMMGRRDYEFGGSEGEDEGLA